MSHALLCAGSVPRREPPRSSAGRCGLIVAGAAALALALALSACGGSRHEPTAEQRLGSICDAARRRLVASIEEALSSPTPRGVATNLGKAVALEDAAVSEALGSIQALPASPRRPVAIGDLTGSRAALGALARALRGASARQAVEAAVRTKPADQPLPEATPGGRLVYAFIRASGGCYRVTLRAPAAGG